MSIETPPVLSPDHSNSHFQAGKLAFEDEFCDRCIHKNPYDPESKEGVQWQFGYEWMDVMILEQFGELY